MCPLNYYVCKPVKEESTEFDTTRKVTALSMASSGTPPQKCPATKNLKLTHPTTYYRQALTRDKRVVMALANELSECTTASEYHLEAVSPFGKQLVAITYAATTTAVALSTSTLDVDAYSVMVLFALRSVSSCILGVCNCVLLHCCASPCLS